MHIDHIIELFSFHATLESLQANAHVWHDAVAAIANKTMDVNAAGTNSKITLLHLACLRGKVDVVQQLLQLHANPSAETLYYKSRPMHHAAMSTSSNVLEICKLLPVADLAYANTSNQTPLFVGLRKPMDPDLFQWMIQQPQCDVIAHYTAIMYQLRRKETFIRMVDKEVAARKRWTPARATWCAAACVCA